MSGRIFRLKKEEEYSDMKKIKAGIPQGSVLDPIFYLLYTSDIPQTAKISLLTTQLSWLSAVSNEVSNKLQARNKVND